MDSDYLWVCLHLSGYFVICWMTQTSKNTYFFKLKNSFRFAELFFVSKETFKNDARICTIRKIWRICRWIHIFLADCQPWIISYMYIYKEILFILQLSSLVASYIMHSSLYYKHGTILYTAHGSQISPLPYF